MRIVEWAPVGPVDAFPPFGAAFEAHVNAYRNSSAKVASLSAWTLLYRVLRENGLPAGTVVFGEHGKPYFSDDRVHFSLSHGGGLVAVSLSDAPTGVDIELCDRPIRPHLVERCLSEREKQYFDGDFIRLWCRKESIAKLTGEGIYGYPVALDSFDPRFDFTETLVRFHENCYRLTAAFAAVDITKTICDWSGEE